MKNFQSQRWQRGFSLIELIATIVILTTIALLTIPAFDQLVKSARLTNAGRIVVDELSLAQQAALTKNSPVEVRLLMLPDEGTPLASPTAFRALQAFANGENGLVPLGKPTFLPAGVFIDPDTTRSSLLDGESELRPLADASPRTPSADQPLPKYGLNYKYIAIVFRGNGETNLNQAPCFFTLVSRSQGNTQGSTNFVTIQIDALNGRVRSFRP